MNHENQPSCDQRRNGIFLAVTAILTLLASLSHAEPLDWSGYAKSFDITFPGYSGTETLTDFPVLVRLSAARNDFRYNICKLANGEDIRFSDSNGNLLASEVDTWDPNGESLVWVKVLSLNADTVITAHYGCANPVTMNPKDVWSNGYIGVWHLNESGTTFADSTGDGLPFTATHADLVGRSEDGLIGNAVAFDIVTEGDNAHKGHLYLSDSNHRYCGRSTMTIEYWVWQRESAHNRRLMYCKTGNDRAYDIYSQRSSGGYDKCSFVFGTTNTTTSATAAPTATVNGNDAYFQTWKYHSAVYDSEVAKNITAYIDGDPKTSVAVGEGDIMLPTVRDLRLGNLGSNQAFPGKFDELRISGVARSAAWIQATYDTVNNLDFAVATVPNDWKKYTHTFSITFPGAPATALTDFPVLVKLSQADITDFSYSDFVKPNGEDLRFADDEGNLLDSEIDTWNPNGVSTVWVKVPTLSSSTVIKAYYGWSFAPVVDSKAVWSNGYVGVWHLGENERPLRDSSSSGLDFTSSYTEARLDYLDECIGFGEDGGAVGKAVRFGVQSNNSNKNGKGGLLAFDPESKLGGFSAMTGEIWAKPNDWDTWDTSTDKYLFSKRLQNTPKTVVFNIYYGKTSLRPYTYFGVDTQQDGTTSGFSAYGSSSQSSMTNQVVANRWYYHAIRFDRTASHSIVSYLNGTSHYSRSGTIDYDIISYPDPLCLGNNPNPNQVNLFQGSLDELRISNVARSVEWLKATYDTIQNNETFAQYSAVTENVRGTILIFK